MRLARASSKPIRWLCLTLSGIFLTGHPLNRVEVLNIMDCMRLAGLEVTHGVQESSDTIFPQKVNSRVFVDTCLFLMKRQPGPTLGSTLGTL